MEKVQFQLEATLPELKDLYEKGLFTKSEINQITKKRTSFETSLIRKVTRKEDFFKYAEYEINLERLRKVRYKKLKYHLNPPPPSASSFSLPRRALYILKRATAKFPGDLATWLAYVEYASREGMRKIVGKGLNNALQHHPTSSTLYLLQTYYHLHPGSPFPRESIPSTSKLDLPSASTSNQPPGFAIEGIDPARTTLLLGLRLLPQSRDLWREYIKLELGWVEALRRRWKLLGIKDSLTTTEHQDQIEGDSEGIDQDALKGGEGAFGEEGEEARKSILAGQLVIHALSSALESIPITTTINNQEQGDGMDFRYNLINMLRNYPSPLRSKCLSAIYQELARCSQHESGKLAAKAELVSLTKGLYDIEYDPEREQVGEGEIVLSGIELVEELGKIGKEVRKSIKGDNKENKDWIEVVGLWLIEQIDNFSNNVELRDYLSSILSTITKPSLQPPPALLIAHLAQLATTSPDLKIARSYAAIYPSNPSIQLYRLSAEIGESDDSSKICEEIARSVTKSNLSDDDREKVRAIWKLWIDQEIKQSSDEVSLNEKRWKSVLLESMKSGSNIPGLHGDIVGYYMVSSIKQKESVGNILKSIKSYQPTFNTYQIIFDSLNSSDFEIDFNDLKKIYDSWRLICKLPFEKAQAGLTIAKLLLSIKGKGREAYDLIENVKREIRQDENVERYVEKEWKALLDAVKEESGESEDDDDDDDDDEDESMNED